MTREELIEDIKKTIPDVLETIQNEVDWDSVISMINNPEKFNESSVDLETECIYVNYALHKGLPL